MALNTLGTLEGEFDEAQSDIILLVEEPEIYQHPHKQKLVGEAFRTVCNEFNKTTGIRFQIAFATHSEKFLDISNFHTARIVRKETVEDIVQHSISALSISACSNYFAGLVNKEPMSDEAFTAKLHIFTREICEGFFAQKVILVEGVTDKAVLEGYYASKNRDSLAEGTLIVSVEGKGKMDKPFYIFNQLGIPTFAVFDSDLNSNDKKIWANTIIQQIAGVENPVEYPSGCFDRFAAFEKNLEKYLKERCGDEFEGEFAALSEQFGLPVSEICKTPAAVAIVVKSMQEKGKTFPMFDQIIDKVDQFN